MLVRRGWDSVSLGGFNIVDKIPIRILHTEKTHEDSHLLDLIRLRVKMNPFSSMMVYYLDRMNVKLL